MQQFIDSIIHLWPVLAAMGGGFVWLCKWFTKQNKRTEKERTALCDGMQAMLRQSIIDNHTKYMERGYITIHGLEHVEKLYTAYTALGGNSFVGELMNDIRALPVKGSATK